MEYTHGRCCSHRNSSEPSFGESQRVNSWDDGHQCLNWTMLLNRSITGSWGGAIGGSVVSADPVMVCDGVV